MENPYTGQGITIDDKPLEKVEYIIDGFLAKGAITTYFAPAKHGKSVVAQALSKYICKNTSLHVQYFDFDNGLVSLVERGWFEIVEELQGKMDYISKDKVLHEGNEAISELLKYAHGSPSNSMEGYVLIFDSATNFMPFDNEDSAKKLFRALAWFRSKGATVILLHHMNKSGRDFQGSNVFATASDNIYEHTKVEENDFRSIFTHKRRDTRFSDMIDIAFEVQKNSFDMTILDYKDAVIPAEIQGFIDGVTKLMRREPGIKQGDLLEKMGYRPADKKAKAILDQYMDRYWKTEKGAKNATLYFLI